MQLRVGMALVVPLVAVLVSACSTGSERGSGDGTSSPIAQSKRPIRMMKTHYGLKAASAPSGAQLTYFGGRIVSNIQVVQVLWGSGNYLPQVSSTHSTAGASMGAFYRDVTSSPYFDWLTEYNTPSGTNQTIGHGSFAQQVQITPSNSSTTIDDSAIQSEISVQIQSGVLPAPTQDGTGNNNTYYAVFFPNGITITQGGANSCQPGGFCAYRGTIANAGGQGEVYYGVHPDMHPSPGTTRPTAKSAIFAMGSRARSRPMASIIRCNRNFRIPRTTAS